MFERQHDGQLHLWLICAVTHMGQLPHVTTHMDQLPHVTTHMGQLPHNYPHWQAYS